MRVVSSRAKVMEAIQAKRMRRGLPDQRGGRGWRLGGWGRRRHRAVVRREPGGEEGAAAGVASVEDCEDGFEVKLGAWDATRDPMTGGSASANVAVRDGALVVTGEIARRPALPWPGVIWMPGEQPMQPVDSQPPMAIIQDVYREG